MTAEARRPRISVVVPCYNEEAVIRATHQRLVSVLSRAVPGAYEIVYVDDGSRDRTRAMLREFHVETGAVRVIALSRNFGHQVALSAGLDSASGDAVIVIDADLQDPPELIPDMIKQWEEGADVVYGVRSDRAGDSRVMLWTRKVFYRLLNRISKVRIPLDAGDFRLMDRRVVQALIAMPERDRYLRGMVTWVGFRQVALPYNRPARYAGTSKYSVFKLMQLAADGVVSFSFAPLRLAVWMGLFAVAIAVAGIVFAVAARLYYADGWIPPGWASLLVAVLFMGGTQLICLGITGEYIGRIYGEVKQRPLYFVQERLGFEVARRRAEISEWAPQKAALGASPYEFEIHPPR